MQELPKTEQELNDLIEQRVSEEREKLVSQHNGAMANMRKKYESDLQKAKDQANMTAEEIAQQKIKEQQDADFQELQELRTYKKTNEIATRLAKEGLPSYFKNDTRLLNADTGDLDKVIKDVKKEYEQTLPKGATHSTIVTTASGQKQQPQGSDDKTQLFEEVGNALKGALEGE